MSVNAILMSLFFAGCFDIASQDLDGDGILASEDCDDGDASIGAPTLWSRDGDGDGFGSVTDTLLACEGHAGLVADQSDCDDSRADVSPAAQEVCGGGDDDCDGLVDDEDPSVDLSTGAVSYVDVDGDGFYADDAAEVLQCASGGARAGDCDDSRADVSPAAQEACGDGVDNNCDGGASGCLLPEGGTLSSGAAWVLGAEPGAGAGYAIAAIDLDRDGLDEVVVGSPHHNANGLKGTGAIHILANASLSGGEVSLSSGTLLYGAEDDVMGVSMVTGDFVGDGYADLVVGAGNGERVWLLQGRELPVDGGSYEIDAVASGVVAGGSERFGHSLSAADLDQDGFFELFVGAADGGQGAGAVYLFYGAASAWGAERSSADADAIIYGGAEGDLLTAQGSAHADYDGDGTTEAVLAASGDGSADYGGQVYVLWGLSRGDVLVAADADTILSGAASGDRLGWSIAHAGDLNGDGYADMAVGAPGEGTAGERAGAVYVFLGGASRWASLSDASVVVRGSAADMRLGSAAAGVGDVTGDGAPDLLVGEAGYEMEAGALYLLDTLGVTYGEVSLSVLGHSIAGRSLYAKVGAHSPAVAVGNINGDGAPDVLIGAPGSDEAAVFHTGGL